MANMKRELEEARLNEANMRMEMEQLRLKAFAADSVKLAQQKARTTRSVSSLRAYRWWLRVIRCFISTPSVEDILRCRGLK